MKPLYFIGWLLSWTTARIVFRMKVHHRENIPDKGPFIIASNHKSLADPQIVGSQIHTDVHFMAKKELFRNPIFGRILKRVNAHPINRAGFDRKAIETAMNILQSGESIVIFPEGTRAKKVDFLPVRPGIGKIARTALAPVLPVFVSGSNKLSACFWGKERLNIFFGKIMTSEQITEYEDNKDGYRKLAENIMDRIKDLKIESDRRVN